MNVVVVKRRGASSKNAGQEYEETLAYCRDVRNASLWLFNHIIRANGADAQAAAEVTTRSLADVEALMAVVDEAQRHVLAAVESLETNLAALGLSQKELVKALAAADTPAKADGESSGQ
ncbi:hypothetical protein APY03_0600 [Variovorax sp. WDL1]|nr:hypothetical protein APY03_0600 [Variovorax sp. WDL1]